MVCESQRALSLIRNQNLVSRPCLVLLFASEGAAMSSPDNDASEAFNEQTVRQRNTVTKGDGYRHIDSQFGLRAQCEAHSADLL